MMITIVFKDWFTGQYKYEFTLNGDWDHEVMCAKRLGKRVDADKSNRMIIIYYQEVSAMLWFTMSIAGGTSIGLAILLFIQGIFE